MNRRSSIVAVVFLCCLGTIYAAQPQPRAKQMDAVGSRGYTNRPINTAVLVGQSVSFYCVSNFSATLMYFFVPIGNVGGDYTVLVSECIINNAFTTDYAVANIVPRACDLVVKSAKFSLAGGYSCKEETGFERDVSAQLVVLNADPICTINSTSIFEFEVIQLRCRVNYTSNLSPILMAWLDDLNVYQDPYSNFTTAGYTESVFLITAHPPSLPVMKLLTYFSTPVNLQTDATNTPSYNHTWFSPNTLVKYQLMVPQNLTVSIGAGAPINMTCRRRSQNILWNFVKAGQTATQTIVTGCAVLPTADPAIGVDNSLDACHLTINPVDVDLAGTYSCQDVMSLELDLNSAYLHVLP